MIKYLNNKLDSLLLLAIFLDNQSIMGIPIFYSIIFTYLLFISLFGRTLFISRNFVIASTCIMILSLFMAFIQMEGFLLIFKQFSPFVLIYLAYYNLLRNHNFDIVGIFTEYLNLSYFLAIIGLIQIICYLVGFTYGYDFGYIFDNYRFASFNDYTGRLSSICSEPSHFFIAISPACFISFYNLTQKNKYFINLKKSITIMLSVLMTFSSLAYIVLVVQLLLILNFRGIISIKKIKLMLVYMTILFFSLYGLYQIRDIKMRVDDGIQSFIIGDFENGNKLNATTFALFTNYWVAKESFIHNFPFGTGLGTYEINYYKYIYSTPIMDIQESESFGLNYNDANSLFFRIMSDLGLIGIVFIFILLIKNFIKKNTGETEIYLILINYAAFTHILSRMIRFGHYFFLGFGFFLCLYTCSKKLKSLKQIKIKKEY